MVGFRGEVRSMSSLKGVTLLAAAFTFLLSALIWSLPGERFLSKRSITSDSFTNGDHVKTRIKKSTDDTDSCRAQTPAPEDVARMQLPNRDNESNNQHMYDSIYGQGHVLCLAETDCTGETVLSVKCRTNGCPRFVVKREHSDVPLYDVSPESLEDIIGLQRSNKAQMKLVCYKGKPHNISEGNWQPLDIHHRTQHQCKGSENATITRRVHVISVRYLSRSEVFTRMKRLTKLVKSPSSEIRVLDFPNYQSVVWRDIDNLALLLQGQVFHNESNYTLVDKAKEEGFNVRLFDLSEEDYQHSLSLKNIIKDDQSECLNVKEKHETIFDQVPSCDCSIYQGGELYTEQKLAHLTNCLSRVNAMNSDEGLLTMTFLENTNWDTSLEHTVDVAITNIVTNIIHADCEAVVLLLSDVGNPSFSSLYNSLFLQTQPFNPFLFIFLPTASQGEDKHSMLAENRDKLISLRDIHVTISDFLSSDGDIDSGSKYEDTVDQYRGLSLLRSIITPRPSTMLGVQSPNLGICEADPIAFPNDTIQVAYAETVVGLINNYIQKKTKIDKEKMSDNTPKCHSVVGKRFMNVRKWYRRGVSFTSMDLEIGVVATNLVKMLTGIILNVQSSPDSNNTISLDSTNGDINTVMEKQILPLACTETMEVSVSLIRPAQVPLLLGQARSFGGKPKITVLHSECLLLLIHGFRDSASYYVMNVCDDREYDFTFTGHLVNVFSVMELPARVFLLPGQVHFLTSFMKSSYFVSKYSFHYETYHNMKVI